MIVPKNVNEKLKSPRLSISYTDLVFQLGNLFFQPISSRAQHQAENQG